MRQAFTVGLFAALASPLAAQAPVPTPSVAGTPGTVSVFAEDDGFQVPFGSWKPTDRNYTMGLGVQWLGGGIGGFLLNRPLDLADRVIGAVQPSRSVAYTSGMVHLSAFTPQDLHRTRPVLHDRPWACLAGWTGRRVYPTTEDALTAEFTIGTIGSPACKYVQRGVHWAMRWATSDSLPPDPKGWDSQVLQSNPIGIPTARVALQYDRVLLSQDGSSVLFGLPPRHSVTRPTPVRRHFELAASVEGQAGYYTEFDPGLTLRTGSFTTPFWSVKGSPLGGGSTVAFDGGHERIGTEGFLFGVIRARLIQYNALLTGYGMSDRTYQLSQADVEHQVREAMFGASILHRWSGGEISFTYVAGALRSHDFKTSNPRFLEHYVWGGMFFTLRFGRDKRST